MPRKIFYVKSTAECPTFKCKKEATCKYDEIKRVGSQCLCQRKQILSMSCDFDKKCSIKRKDKCPIVNSFDQLKYLP